MDEDLINHVRLLIEDTSDSPVVSSPQIENIAVNRRRLIYYEALVSEDDLTFYHARKYIETLALSDSYEGDPLTGYTKDALEGSFTFGTEQITVYLHGYAYDLEDIAAQLWLVKAGVIDAFPGLSYSLGDESVDKGTAKEYCINQYWKYKKSKGGQLRRR